MQGKEVEEWLMGSGDEVTREDTDKVNSIHQQSSLGAMGSGLFGMVSSMNFNNEDLSPKDTKPKAEMGLDTWMFEQIDENKQEEDGLDPFEAIKGDFDSVETPDADEEDFENLNEFIDNMDKMIYDS